MTTRRQRIEIRGLPIEVLRKNIKNLHLGVYPPNGRVRIAAPLRLTDDALRLAIITRLGWIRRQRSFFESQDRQSRREMVSGESHYVGGRRYRLTVFEHTGPFSVRLASSARMIIRAPHGSNANERDAALQKWYRARLRSQISALVAKWESRIGATVSEFRVRKMKTRWGSCNQTAGRIWLNLELAKKSPSCVEYVVVHEMVHLIERRHNVRFRELMDVMMPNWLTRRAELNRAPLAHEGWKY